VFSQQWRVCVAGVAAAGFGKSDKFGQLRKGHVVADLALRGEKRLCRQGAELEAATRWLLGRTWGDVSTSLKLENRFAPALVASLKAAGHHVELLDEAFSDTMGHAGALVRHPNGVIEGAADPRSDGAVAGV